MDHLNNLGRKRKESCHTFMCIVLEKRTLLGGCRRRTPCIKSSALTMRRSYCPSPPLATSQSRVGRRRCAMFHSNPSWSLKNSRKAGSDERSASALRGGFGDSWEEEYCAPRGLAVDCLEDEEDDDGPERQICARRPSTCLRPFLILIPS